VYVCWDIIYLSKSNHIGGCKNVQNTKKCSILHILTQKTPIPIFVKMFKSTQRPCKWIVTVHICTVTVACAHNILIIFFLSSLYLTLISLSFSHFIKDSLRHTTLSFSHLINLFSSSFRRSPPPLMRTRSSKRVAKRVRRLQHEWSSPTKKPEALF